MKKLLSVFIGLLLVLSLCACGGEKEDHGVVSAEDVIPGSEVAKAASEHPAFEVTDYGSAVRVTALEVIDGRYDEADHFNNFLTVHIEFTGLPAQSSAWMGLIPADVEHGSEKDSDAVCLDYHFLSDIENNTVVFQGFDGKAGDYEVRVFDSDDAEVAHEIAYVYGITLK